MELLRRFVDVCNAVAYAHSRGVLHRDLKPANIMLGPYGETLVVDWGLAKAAGRQADTPRRPRRRSGPRRWPTAASTLPGMRLGTPSYMSPEQAAGQLDLHGPASDVYSLGATLYHLLTGRAPFQDADVFATLRKVRCGRLPSAPVGQRPRPPGPRRRLPQGDGAEAPRPLRDSPALADEIEHWLADEPVLGSPRGCDPHASPAGPAGTNPRSPPPRRCSSRRWSALSVSTALMGREASASRGAQTAC